MEQVLKRLYEIETAADAIMQKADERKKQMAKEMEEKTAAFDQKTQEETAETIAQKKEELMEQIQKELDAQHSETERLLADEQLTIGEKAELVDQVYSSIRGFGLLDSILKDDDITEIMINGPKEIFIEK